MCPPIPPWCVPSVVDLPSRRGGVARMESDGGSIDSSSDSSSDSDESESVDDDDDFNYDSDDNGEDSDPDDSGAVDAGVMHDDDIPSPAISPLITHV